MTDTMSLRGAIESQNAKFMEAAENGNVAALVSLYTDDAWLLPPGAEMMRGRAGIEAFWSSLLSGIAAVKLTTVDVVALGENAAREVGTALIVIKGQEQRLAGKYIVIWRQVEGEWMLESDIWNNDR